MAETMTGRTDRRDAMYRPEIGWISFIWGDASHGIAHLIKRRNQQGGDGEAFARRIPEIIANGKMGPYYLTGRGNNLRRNIVWAGDMVVVDPGARRAPRPHQGASAGADAGRRESAARIEPILLGRVGNATQDPVLPLCIVNRECMCTD